MCVTRTVAGRSVGRYSSEGTDMRCAAWCVRAGAVAVVAAACLSLSTQAWADDHEGWVRNGYLTREDANYLANLRGSGVRVPMPSGAVVQVGHLICQNLHRGVRPDDPAMDRYFPTVGMPQLIAAAQAELCPDTLG